MQRSNMVEAKDIKLILVDCDGTILRDDKSVDAGLVSCINQLEERGIKFSYVTGRNIYSTLSLDKDLEFKHPFAVDNGANVYSGLDLLDAWIIPQKYNNRLLAMFAERDRPFLAYAHGYLFYHKSDKQIDNFRKKLQGHVHTELYDPHKDYNDLEFYKMTMVADGIDDMDAWIAEVAAEYTGIKLARTEGNLYVLSSLQATKGRALKRLCEIMDVSPLHCMTFGDNYNDRSLLEEAAIAVAVGNAEDDIKAVADFVIATNNEDGVSAFLKEFFDLA